MSQRANPSESPLRGRPLLSVVVPCYNEEESLPTLVDALVPTLEKISGGSWELLLVDDGSADRTAEMIASAHRRDNRVRGVILSRNFGHQAAIVAGLSYASGQFIGIMDADLQDPPEVLAECLEHARSNNCDLVYAVRRRRDANPFLKLAYWLFYRVMNQLSEYPWPLDSGDFCVFNRRVLRLLQRLPEHVRVVRGLRSWVGLKQGCVAYDRPDRQKGISKYSVMKLASLALNSLVSFSTVPLRFASLLGIGMSVLSTVIAALLVANRFFPQFTLFSYYIGQNPGTTTIVTLLLGISSLLFFCIGILGEYLGLLIREVKRRPVAIVQNRVGVEPSDSVRAIVFDATDPVGE